MASSSTSMATPNVLEIFDKRKCKIWLEKLEFVLRKKKIDYVFIEPRLGPRFVYEPYIYHGYQIDKKSLKWREDDNSCHNFILRAMFKPDQLCDKCKTAKELWDTLKSYYEAEEKYESWRELRLDFSLRQKGIAYVLIESCPNAPGNNQVLSDQAKHVINGKITKWKEDDYSCRNLILQAAVVPQYAKYKTAKELRDVLRTVFMTETPDELSELAEDDEEIMKLLQDEVEELSEQFSHTVRNSLRSQSDWEIMRLKRELAQTDHEEMMRLKQKEAERDMEISCLRHNLAQTNHQEIMNLKHKVAQIEEQNTWLKHEVSKRDTEILRIKNKVTWRDDEIMMFNKLAETDYEEIVRLKQKLAQRDKEIIKLDQELAQRAEKIVAQEHEVARRDEEIVRLKQELAQTNEVSMKLKEEVAQRDEKIVAQEHEVAQRDEEIVRLKQELDQTNEVTMSLKKEAAQRDELKTIHSYVIPAWRHLDNMIRSTPILFANFSSCPQQHHQQEQEQEQEPEQEQQQQRAFQLLDEYEPNIIAHGPQVPCQEQQQLQEGNDQSIDSQVGRPNAGSGNRNPTRVDMVGLRATPESPHSKELILLHQMLATLTHMDMELGRKLVLII